MPTGFGAICVVLALAAGGSDSARVGDAARPPEVVLKDGRLSLDAEGRTLEWVLGRISRSAGFPIVVDETAGEAVVSLRFQDLPLEEGLRRLLRDHDAFFFYGAQDGAPAALRVVWVYPKGHGRFLEPVPPERWASTREIEKLLDAPDAEDRSRAIESLVERKGEKARGAVLRALRDENARVRTQALYSAFSSGLEVPAEVLAQALDDPSVDVRFLALEAVGDRPEAATLARRALGDQSPHVRERAKQILDRLAPKGVER
jgi:HEAT repeat protein